MRAERTLKRAVTLTLLFYLITIAFVVKPSFWLIVAQVASLVVAIAAWIPLAELSRRKVQ